MKPHGTSLTARIPATPNTLLRPNVASITRAQRAKLDYPLNVKAAPVIKSILRTQLRETAGWAAREAAPTLPITGDVMVHYLIVWEKGRKLVDFDTAVAILKGPTDALMDAGWIVDDSQVRGMTVRQRKRTEPTGYIDVWLEIIADEEAA